MNIRIARKIVSVHKGMSKRMEMRLNKLYPPYYDEQGNYCSPSWHMYHRIHEAWVVINRKIRKYDDKFRML